MAKKKTRLRRELSPRQIRWRVSRGLVAAAPFLRRSLNFHGRAISLEAASARALFEDVQVLDAPFRHDEVAFITARCRPQDGPADPEYWVAPWRFSVGYHLLRDVELLSHTGRLADAAGRGLITPEGAPEDRNGDKIALLRDGAPVSGTALPVRRYNNYFHFMLEAALPLTAYFEHPGRESGPHAIVTAPVAGAFARETLRAIAKRYGARFIEQAPGVKTPLERAVSYVRRSPCSDWPMARPETAAALRAALLAHLGGSIDGRARRRLYLRRGPAKIRNLSNGRALQALADREGFETLEPVSANLAEQARLPAEAETILAVHGAALGNLLFARPGAEVIEIFAADFCKSVYMMLCRQLGLRHRRVISGTGDFQQNFEVDIEAVAAALRA